MKRALFGIKKVKGSYAFMVLVCLVIGLTSIVMAYNAFHYGKPYSGKNAATETDAEEETTEKYTEEVTTEDIATYNDATEEYTTESNGVIGGGPVTPDADVIDDSNNTENTEANDNPGDETGNDETNTTEHVINTDFSEVPGYDDDKFEVPETSLPDIKTVVGRNWFDTNSFKYAKSVKDEYFDKAVFIGDSRTEGLQLYGGQKNLHTFAYKGMGIFKADTNKVIKVNGTKMTVYKAIENTNYDYYYISYGINEIGYPSTDSYVEKMNKLIDHIFEHNPNAIIYVCSIIPVSKNCSEKSDVFTLDAVKRFNDAQYQMCMDRGDVIYLDTGAATADAEGYLPAESTSDGKHPSANYYKRVMAYIRLHIVNKK